MAGLEEAAAKAWGSHGLGKGRDAEVKSPQLREELKACGPQEVELTISNMFFKGYDHEQLDWSRPVHAVVVDFKGDSMQLGMLAQRLEARGEQYVFLATGNPGFNGGWHFSAVDDFEHPEQQRRLDEAWRGRRVWTQVNYIASVTSDGSPALTPRAAIDAQDPHAGAIPVTPTCRFAGIYFTGGLMAHTLIATAIGDDRPLGKVLAKHTELGAKVCTIGHGLDVVIACGTASQSLGAGLAASVYPKQERLLQISGMKQASDSVCSDAWLVSASHWGPETAQRFFAFSGLEPRGAADMELAGNSERIACKTTSEPVLALDVGQLPGMTGATFVAPGAAPGAMSAVFVDDVADTIEVYATISHLLSEGMSFCCISHSCEDGTPSRTVTTETVFGNPMYGLRECVCRIPTTPANMLPLEARFDSFFVVGGQAPYQMIQDAAITAIMDGAEVAAAVCHGPEVLIGSKWMSSSQAKFTSYSGCWMSFRDVLDRYQRLKPGETCQDQLLFSGNAPNSTKEMVTQACAAIKAHRAAASA